MLHLAIASLPPRDLMLMLRLECGALSLHSFILMMCPTRVSDGAALV